MINIHILTENMAGGKFLAEHGLSYLIEANGEKILFDTGHSDIFLQNAVRMGFDINKEVNKVVLSHGHWDHGNGLQFLNHKKLITHPGAFVKRFRKTDSSPIGLSLSKEEISEKFDLEESPTAIQLTENLYFLGEIPRLNDFESQTTPFKLENNDDDFIDDDSALVAIENNRLIIISGCAHSGICNICEQAKKVTGISSIKAVLGGFHLKYQNIQTQKTIGYFKANSIQNIFPSHCTALPALAMFYNEFKSEHVKTGMTFSF